MTHSNSYYGGLRSSVSRRLADMRGKESGVTAQATGKPAKPAASESVPSAHSTPQWLAADRSKDAERSRIANVLESSASVGRERAALEMLAYGNDDAATIVSTLAAMPTDTELNRRRAADSQVRVNGVWDRALSNIGSNPEV